MDAHALHRRGWTISAIARHLGHDRKTIRAYLHGDRVAGQRRRAEPDPFEPFAGYCRERLGEDPHLWATTLFDELLELGYDRSYPTFTRQLRARGLRPACEPCRPAKGRPVAVIEHPPGEETQFDWLELPDPPAHWGWGSRAFLLVGALAHSGRWRGVLAESTDQPHLIDALHRVCAGLGGLTRTWRFDRMATVCHPGSGQVTASFAAVAKHYGVSVAICPPRRGNRKGVVEKANHTAAQRWWRTLADDVSVEQAQAAWTDGVCAARRHPHARDHRRQGHRGHRRRRRAVDRAAGAVPRRPDRAAGRQRAGAGLLPRQPLLGAARAGPRPDHRLAPARRGRHRAGHQRRDRHRPPPPRAGRGRCHRPRHRTRLRPGTRRDGRVHHRRSAPPQAAHPTRPGRPGRRRGPARQPLRTDIVHSRHLDR